MVAPMAIHVDGRVGTLLRFQEFPGGDPPIAEQAVERGGLELAVEAQGEGTAWVEGAIGFADYAGKARVAQQQRVRGPLGDIGKLGAKRQVAGRGNRARRKAEDIEAAEAGLARDLPAGLSALGMDIG